MQKSQSIAVDWLWYLFNNYNWYLSMNQIVSKFDLSLSSDRKFLSDIALASKRVASKRLDSQKSDSRDAGLVSILTSQTPSEIVMPSQEYLRLKRLQKTVRIASEIAQEEITRLNSRYKSAMVTLTYRSDVDYSPKQISSYIDCVKKWAKRRHLTVRYVWVLELTKNGKPHYHVLWWIPKGYTMPKADKQGWWKHGMTKSEWARSPVGYLCKYTSKGVDFNSFSKLPRGGRLFGFGGFTSSMRIEKIWRCSPSWVKELFSYSNGVRKFGSYWVDRVTGNALSSPWHFDHVSRVLTFKGFGDVININDLQKYVSPRYTRKMPISVAMYYHYKPCDFEFYSAIYDLDCKSRVSISISDDPYVSVSRETSDPFEVLDYYFDLLQNDV